MTNEAFKKENGEDVKLHIYGAYCPENLRKELHDPDTGFFMHGYHPSSVIDLLADKRVMLSPLRFGAGIKGKHLDAWKAGLPVVTTMIGAEGMWGKKAISGGRVARSDDEFIGGAQNLYNRETKWNRCLHKPFSMLKNFCGKRHWEDVCEGIIHAIEESEECRKKDYFRSILWHQSNRSTKYLSKYIELKETSTTSDSDMEASE